LISDGLLLGPLGSRDASTKVLQGLIRNVDVEGANARVADDDHVIGRCGLRLHRFLLPVSLLQRSDLKAARILVVRGSGSCQTAKVVQDLLSGT
jgi:hypothetical protein